MPFPISDVLDGILESAKAVTLPFPPVYGLGVRIASEESFVVADVKETCRDVDDSGSSSGYEC